MAPAGDIRRNADGSLVRGEMQRLAFIHFADAFADASRGGTLPAQARQLGYALRRRTGLGDELSIEYVGTSPAGRCLLDKYIELHPEAAAWDVVRQPHGNFVTPSGTTIPLGTIAVRNYRRAIGRRVDTAMPRRQWVFSEIPRFGPGDDYGSVLYIEKAGFTPQLQADGVPRRYDLAIASSQGFSVDAARDLLGALENVHELPVFVVHDFDASGVGIAGTIEREVDLIDLGLRWDDIETFDSNGDLDWMAERVAYTRADPRPTLRAHGATDVEIDFLCEHWDPVTKTGHGRRVELNALVTPYSITDWLTERLDEHEIDKAVPDVDVIVAAWRQAWAVEQLNQRIEEIWPDIAAQAGVLDVNTDDLVSLVTTRLNDARERTWREVIDELIEDEG